MSPQATELRFRVPIHLLTTLSPPRGVFVSIRYAPRHSRFAVSAVSPNAFCARSCRKRAEDPCLLGGRCFLLHLSSLCSRGFRAKADHDRRVHVSS